MALPEGTADCYSDTATGPNPDVTGDCDFLPAHMRKAAWPGVKEKWPAAHEILTSFTLSVDQQQPMPSAVDVQGQPVGTVAADWMAANEVEWKAVVDAAIK